MNSLAIRFPRFLWFFAGFLALAFEAFGCGAASDLETAEITSALCIPGDSGGDYGCGCTLNSQCNRFDDDTRLVVCNVPDGDTVGACLDCTARTAGTRPVGCACAMDGDCATGLKCNGRSCQPLRQRGEYCFHDSDCGSDMSGSMTCLLTKSWCGPLAGGYYCDFNSDCLSKRCVLGQCTPGGAAAPCSDDTDCAAPGVCSKLLGLCVDPQDDGQPCARNAECKNQCNSFSGVCTLGKSGVICTTTGNAAGADGDCTTGLKCTDCGGSFTCRDPAGPCG